MMTGSARLVGKAVEWVLRESAVSNRGGNGGWMTVGQVAEACEISKPTARRYMNILADAGIVSRVQGGSRDTVYYAYIIVEGE